MRQTLTAGQLRARMNEAAAKKATATLTHQLTHLYSIPPPVLEHVFYPERGFRLDLAWPEVLLGVDEQGGQRKSGKHNRPDGYARDLEKLALLQWRGWVIIWATPELITQAVAAKWIAALYLARCRSMGVPPPPRLVAAEEELRTFTLKPPECLRSKRKKRVSPAVLTRVRSMEIRRYR